MDYWGNFIQAFVPLFVAMDPIGLLPLYMGLTEGIERSIRQKILVESIITALVIAIGFVFFGQYIFGFMGVDTNDFRIAGGVLLFCLATLDMMVGVKLSGQVSDKIGAVPLGTPLIAGPAVLATSLILVDTFGLYATLLAMVANIMITWGILASSDFLARLLGQAGSKAASKVANLILAAFAVMMIRKGVIELIAGN